MNRKETRKNKKLYSSSKTTSPEISGMIKIFIGIVIAFLVIYFAFAIYNGEIFNDKDSNEDTTEPVFQDTEILAGSTFTNTKEEYIVFYYNFDSDYADMLDVVQEGYAAKNEVKTYKVDLDKGFNKPYVAQSEDGLNKKPKSASELKVVNYTLIRIKNGKVVKYITGVQNIKEYISSISTTQ